MNDKGRMSIFFYIGIFILYCAIHVIMDIVYLYITQKSSQQYIARTQNIKVDNIKKFKIWPAGAFAYLFIILGFWVFVLHDVVKGKEKNKIIIFLKATLLALCIWGTYNLTNYTFFNDYDIMLVIRDTMWGVLSCNCIVFLIYMFVNSPTSLPQQNDV